MTFVGFDLPKRYITACALDASGAVVAEVRQLATAVDTVLDWLAGLSGPVMVAMEATLYSTGSGSSRDCRRPGTPRTWPTPTR